MIDVHSGLGPAGVDTLMTDHGTDGAVFFLFLSLSVLLFLNFLNRFLESLVVLND